MAVHRWKEQFRGDPGLTGRLGAGGGCGGGGGAPGSTLAAGALCDKPSYHKVIRFLSGWMHLDAPAAHKAAWCLGWVLPA